MPMIFCCLCSRRTATAKQRVRVGTDCNWPMLKIHSEKNGLDMSTFSRDDYVCAKCHATISHYRMKDRGPEKIVQNSKPVVYEPGITSDVLRSFNKANKATLSAVNTDDELRHEATSPLNGPEVSVFLDETVLSKTQDIGATNISESDESESVVAANQKSSLLSTHSTDRNVDAPDTTVADEVKNVVPANQEPSLVSTHGIDRNVDVSEAEESESVVAGNQEPLLVSTDPTGNTTESHLSTVEVVEIDISNTMVDLSSLLTGNSQHTVPIISPATALPNETSSLHLKGTKTTQSRCFICQSTNGRKAIPWPAIQQAWFERRCYIPKTNRTCEFHLTASNKFTDDALQLIEDVKVDVNVKLTDFEFWLNGVSDLPKSTPYNFEDDGIEAEKYKMFFGISKEDFDDLVSYLKGMRNTLTRSIRSALAMFLLLLRNNMKQEIIAHNFSTTQQGVSKNIDAVSKALDQHFVPKYLGYYHITRDEALEKHSIKLTSKVLGQEESRLCLIADGTYNYIEKPSDFELQRKTFSLHKQRNLLKPLYIVFPSGYILEAAGPYFCDSKNNDAANIRHHYKHSDLLLFLEDDDYFLFDRGYRDVVDETKDNGQSVFMPSLLTGKRTHFTCEEANSSRKVTMFRWVVEAVNGRIKNVFPFFKHTIEGSYVPKIMRFNRIACAIMNKYFPPLYNNKDFHTVISEEFATHTSQTNGFKDEIELLGLRRMTTRWEKASESSVVDFPKLSMEDLKRITLGTYQIKIAAKYIESHMKEDSHFGIFIHRENEGIIRARIQSRFSKSKTHDAWVKYEKVESGFEAIKGLYCTCKVGERTLGCCSHLTSVIRYLGFDRHQPQQTKFNSRCAWDAIDCDSSREDFSDDSSCDESDI